MTVETVHAVYSSAYTFTRGAWIRCECGWRTTGDNLNTTIDAYVAHVTA